MKKTVVTLLLVLPFILIYFISFTGQILATYKHIFVERIVVLDENGDEYKNEDYIKIAPGEEYNLKIKVYPELATNKKYSISNGNKETCDVNIETGVVTGKEYGISRLIITSQDRHFVQFIINIYVTEDELKDISIVQEEIKLTPGKTEQIEINFDPITTLQEYKGLTFTSLNESVATVSASGRIKAIAEGTTKIIIASTYKPEIVKELNVIVSTTLEKGIWFTPTVNVYSVNTSIFDLKTIISIVDLPNVEYTDLTFSANMTSGVVESDYDISQLQEGIIKFNQENKVVTVTVSFTDVDNNYRYYEDSLKIKWVNN